MSTALTMVANIRIIQGHAVAYRKEAADLNALADEAAKCERFDLEHSYRNEAQMKLLMSELVTKAAANMVAQVLKASKHFLNNLG